MRKLMGALLVAGLVCACGGGDEVFDATSDGEQVAMVVGADIVIQLPGNPSTGYDWYVDTLDEEIATIRAQSFEAESDLVGAGGTTTIRIEAVAPGTTQLRLIYERSFETADPIDDFELTIVVE